MCSRWAIHCRVIGVCRRNSRASLILPGAAFGRFARSPSVHPAAASRACTRPSARCSTVSSRSQASSCGRPARPSFSAQPFVHHNGLVAPAEEIPGVLMPAIEPAGVGAQEPFHADDQVGLGGFGRQLKVAIHQTITNRQGSIHSHFSRDFLADPLAADAPVPRSWRWHRDCADNKKGNAPL